MSTAIGFVSPHELLPSEGFHAYLNYANRQPILSAEEERELFARYKAHNDLEAVRLLILSHLRFVAHIARSYMGYGLSLDDLTQEGNIGLMKSVKRFEPERGVRLASYAVYWIKAEIHEYILSNWKLVKVATTKAQRKLFFNLRKMKRRLGWMSDDEAMQVAEYLDVPLSEVKEMENRLSQSDYFIDQTYGESVPDDGENSHTGLMASRAMLEDHSFDPAEQVIEQDQHEHCQQVLHQVMGKLDPRSRDIVESRWLRPDNTATLKELANKYQISIERVRQIEKSVLSQLRAKLVA